MAYGAMPGWQSLALAALYSAGAHGIMTLNDFKAVKGDRLMGIRSLPVQLGIDGAARMACLIMALPQAVVIALLLHWGAALHAGGVAVLLLAQGVLMLRFIRSPEKQALFYSGFGVPLFVAGMMVSAFALRSLAGAAS
jgi:chlorophyll synthase